jgi:hypothetical protein
MVKLPGPIEKVEGESGPSDAETINVAVFARNGAAGADVVDLVARCVLALAFDIEPDISRAAGIPRAGWEVEADGIALADSSIRVAHAEVDASEIILRRGVDEVQRQRGAAHRDRKARRRYRPLRRAGNAGERRRPRVGERHRHGVLAATLDLPDGHDRRHERCAVASTRGVDRNAHVARLQGCNRHILRCGAVQVVAYCTAGGEAVAGDLPRRCSLRCLSLEDHSRHERCPHRRGEVDAQVLCPLDLRPLSRAHPSRTTGWEEQGRTRCGRDRRCRCLRCGLVLVYQFTGWLVMTVDW